MEKSQFPQNFEVLPLFYWGDILWLKFFFEHQDTAQFSLVQTYRKQRNFNRTYILGGNGIDILTIPVNYEGMFPKINEVKISYKEDWQKQHLKKIFYAYKNSAYFEYFWDTIEKVYQNPTEYLWEFNFNCLKVIQKILHLPNFQITEEFIPQVSFAYRVEETPKIEFPKYFQLFTQNFIPNLSFLDIIMNLGLESNVYLKNIKLNYSELKILKKNFER